MEAELFHADGRTRTWRGSSQFLPPRLNICWVTVTELREDRLGEGLTLLWAVHEWFSVRTELRLLCEVGEMWNTRYAQNAVKSAQGRLLFAMHVDEVGIYTCFVNICRGITSSLVS